MALNLLLRRVRGHWGPALSAREPYEEHDGECLERSCRNPGFGARIGPDDQRVGDAAADHYLSARTGPC